MSISPIHKPPNWNGSLDAAACNILPPGNAVCSIDGKYLEERPSKTRQALQSGNLNSSWGPHEQSSKVVSKPSLPQQAACGMDQFGLLVRALWAVQRLGLMWLTLFHFQIQPIISNHQQQCLSYKRAKLQHASLQKVHHILHGQRILHRKGYEPQTFGPTGKRWKKKNAPSSGKKKAVDDQTWLHTGFRNGSENMWWNNQVLDTSPCWTCHQNAAITCFLKKKRFTIKITNSYSNPICGGSSKAFSWAN